MGRNRSPSELDDGTVSIKLKFSKIYVYSLLFYLKNDAEEEEL